jgi:uncharacterized protein (DUF1778 family)
MLNGGRNMRGFTRERTKRLEMRLTPEEKKRLELLAFLRNQTVTELLISKALSADSEPVRVRVQFKSRREDHDFDSYAEAADWLLHADKPLDNCDVFRWEHFSNAYEHSIDAFRKRNSQL